MMNVMDRDMLIEIEMLERETRMIMCYTTIILKAIKQDIMMGIPLDLATGK